MNYYKVGITNHAIKMLRDLAASRGKDFVPQTDNDLRQILGNIISEAFDAGAYDEGLDLRAERARYVSLRKSLDLPLFVLLKDDDRYCPGRWRTVIIMTEAAYQDDKRRVDRRAATGGDNARLVTFRRLGDLRDRVAEFCESNVARATAQIIAEGADPSSIRIWRPVPMTAKVEAQIVVEEGRR